MSGGHNNGRARYPLTDLRDVSIIDIVDGAAVGQCKARARARASTAIRTAELVRAIGLARAARDRFGVCNVAALGRLINAKDDQLAWSKVLVAVKVDREAPGDGRT